MRLVGPDGLDDVERAALARARANGFRSLWAFPAPDGCRSHVEWIADGARRWAEIDAKLAQAQPTAAASAALLSV
jgi:hypothetical protein